MVTQPLMLLGQTVVSAVVERNKPEELSTEQSIASLRIMLRIPMKTKKLVSMERLLD